MKKATIPMMSFGVLVALATATLLSGSLYSQEQSPATDAGPFIQAVLLAHNAWVTPPNSIRIRGTLIRGNSKQTLTITATGQEEVVTEIGTSKRVATPSVQFQDDGETTSYTDTLDAFSQLDVTNVFLIAQLSRRAEQAAPPEKVTQIGTQVTKVHLWSKRTQTHFRQIKVGDDLDVFVDSSGILLGLERTFYPQDSRLRYTMGYRFSDYRSTGGGVLLPYRIETVFKGNAVEVILVNDYQVNIPLTRLQFQPRVQSRRAQ